MKAILMDSVFEALFPIEQRVHMTGKVLVECCQEVEAQRRKTNDPNTSMVGYEDIGEAAYGSFGRRLVSTTMYTELLGICALLFILEVRVF